MSLSSHFCIEGCLRFPTQLAFTPHIACKVHKSKRFLPKRIIIHREKTLPLSTTRAAPSVVAPDRTLHGLHEEVEISEEQYRGRLEELLQWSPSSPASLWNKFPFLSSPRVRGVLLLNVLTFLYGSNIPIIKETEAIANPSLFLCGRFVLATMVLSPYISSGIRDAEVRNASLELGLWISMGYWTQSFSLLTSDAGRASFISAFTVIAVPLLAGLSGREISKLTWASAITAFVGVGFLETSGSPATVGDLWSLFSAVLFGVHMLRTEHYSRVLPSRKLLPLLSMQLLVITLSSLLWCFMSSTVFKGCLFDLPEIDLKVAWQSILSMPWLPVMYTGIVSTALCLWIELTAMRDISATDTAVIYSLEPLWGAAFAWCFLGERWGPTGWFGALLILGGSLSVQLFQARDGAPDMEKSKQQ